jgi:hypothetical protein
MRMVHGWKWLRIMSNGMFLYQQCWSFVCYYNVLNVYIFMTNLFSSS